MVNGSVCGSVVPSTGLRQDDHISPYLFILVADAFSAMLNKATRMKQIHGVRVLDQLVEMNLKFLTFCLLKTVCFLLELHVRNARR